MSIVTDSTPVEAAKDPADSTILALYHLFATPGEVARMEEKFRLGGIGYGTFKQQLFEAIWAFFEPMRARREQILADPGYVDGVLAEGAAKATKVASQILQRVKIVTGLTRK